MPSEILITPTQQYNIDSIRRIRLELDIVSEELSLISSPSKHLKYIGNIESSRGKGFYTDAAMVKIASYFSKVAKERQKELIESGSNDRIKTEYSIRDFYPPKPLEDKLQIKTSIPIPKGVGPTVTLNAVIETEDFFDRERTLKEIVSYCNKFDNKNWKESDFTATLERAVGKGKLKKYYDQEEKVFYIKSDSK